MRSKFLLATSVLAMAAATSAQANTSGSLDAGISYGAETSGMNSHFWIKSMSGQLEFNLDDQWNGQFELFGSTSGASPNSWFGKYDDESGLSTYGGTLHVNTDVNSDFKVGGFLMMEETTVGDTGFEGYNYGGNLYLAVGGEARWNASPDFDIVGQLGGLFNVDAPGPSKEFFSPGGSDCGSLCNAFFVNLGATWFMDDNNSFGANFGYITGQGAGFFFCCSFSPVSQTGWDYGVRFEHEFDDSPFSVYLAYDGNSFAYDGYSQQDNVISVGVKFYFNGDTMRRQHDIAPFKTPHFERMINLSGSADDMCFPNC